MKSPRARIAELTGLCEATVSFALNGHPRVKAKTRERVLEVARSIGYTPNRPARRLAQSRFSKAGNRSLEHIGFVVFCSTETPLFEIYTKILLGVEFEVSKQNSPLYFIRLDPQDYDRRFNMLEFEDVDGWLLTGQITDDVLSRINKWNKPYVVIGEKQSTIPANQIDNDYETQSAHAVERLIHSGHKQIAIYQGGLDYCYQRQILSGYKSEHKKHGLTANPRFILQEHSTTPEKLRKITSREITPTALIIAEPNRSLDIIYNLESNGIRIPEDISILSFETSTPENRIPAISHFVIPFFDIGTSAVSLLKSIQAGSTNDSFNRKIKSRYIVGSTIKQLES